MSEQNGGQSAEQQQNGGNTSGYTPPATQADLDSIIEARLQRERAKFSDYDDLKAKAAQVDAANDAKKTAEQRLSERIAALEEHNKTLTSENLRAKVAADKGVPASLLSGDTEEALTASADALLAFRGDVQQPPRGVHVPGEGRAPRSQNDPKAEALSVLGFGD